MRKRSSWRSLELCRGSREGKSRYESAYWRQLKFETLEDRRLLAIDITGVTSLHDNFRFISGQDIPAAFNTYQAQITGGTPTRVDFSLGGTTLSDSTAADGWSAVFNMSALTSVTDLVVRAYQGTTQVDSFTRSVSALLLPTWFHSAGVSFNAAVNFVSGYDLNMTVSHIDEGFDTPSDWVFYVPGVADPLFDMADLHTGFTVQSRFTINSAADGNVTESNFQIDLGAEVLDQSVFNETFSYTTTGSRSFSFDNGVIEVSGAFNYGASLSPNFNNNLVLDGISGNAWVDPSLTITFPLGAAKIPLLSVPGAADINLSAQATIGFHTAPGQLHTLSITPTVTSGGFGISAFELNPSLSAAITGTGSLSLGWGAGTAGASISGTLEQSFIAHYSSASGWTKSAPGSLTVSGNAFYDSLWGLGPSGSVDLFQWTIASWDFLSGTGSSQQATQSHTYESGVLTNAWKSSTPGPHDSLTFQVDYSKPGTAPQLARLLVDESTYYNMTLINGTADNGVYAVTIVGVGSSLHDYHFIFIDAAGGYHIQGFDIGPDRVAVLSVDPVNGGPMVARNANVTITFSEQMDMATLNSSTIHIVGSVSGMHDGAYGYSGTTLVVAAAKSTLVEM